MDAMAAWGAIIVVLLIVQIKVLGRMPDGGGYLGKYVMSINRVIEKVFLVRGCATQQVFHCIPWVGDYKEGGAYTDTLLSIGNSVVAFAEEMSNIIQGPASTAGPQAFLDGYKNYSVRGMMVVALCMRFVIQGNAIYLVRQKRSDILSLVSQELFFVFLARTGYGSLLMFKVNGMHVLLILRGLIVVLRKVSSMCLDRKPAMSYSLKEANSHHAT